jgi:poly-gamma-glutamate capsule biosynthesis protein CapA/YwtB (metallophosphatase superfamily)
VQHFQGYSHGGKDDWSLLAPPEVAADLKALGFDLLSLANNHSMDWGIEGLRETSLRLDEAGLVHAGVGENRAMARSARYLETPARRVGFIALVSTFRDGAEALPAAAKHPGDRG